MRNTGKCLILAALIAFLCGSAIAGDQVPYKATLASTNVAILPPGIPGNDCPNYIPLPDGRTMAVPEGLGIFKFIITAVGNSTLMGLTADVQSHCTVMPLDPKAPPPPIGTTAPFFNGSATLTGANGDKIFGTYSGIMTVTEQGMVIDGILVTNGGTGRFKGATGVGRAFGVQSLTTGDSALTITGKMSSPGSLKH